jgi:hypothetical protein
MAPIVNASFPVLLGLMQQLVANSSPTPQVAEFMKLVCKVRCAMCDYMPGWLGWRWLGCRSATCSWGTTAAPHRRWQSS